MPPRTDPTRQATYDMCHIGVSILNPHNGARCSWDTLICRNPIVAVGEEGDWVATKVLGELLTLIGVGRVGCRVQ